MEKTNELPKLNELPYANTTISIERTQADISQLLMKYKIEGYQWTHYKGRTVLRFIYNNKIYMLYIPRTYARKYNSNKRNWEEIEVPPKITYRIFFWALKSLLEMTQYNLFTLDRLLLAYQVLETDNGLVTIGHLIESNPRYLLPGPDKVLFEEK